MPLEQLQNTMALRTSAFLNTLTPEQRQHSVFPFSSNEHFNWNYRPRQRQGLPFKGMTTEQRAAAEALLQFSLSEVGYQKAHNIMQLENVLRQIDRFPHLRDPEQYAFTIFGNPNVNPWGWRLEGHHLVLHFMAIADGLISVTPTFFGANPAEVPRQPYSHSLARFDQLILVAITYENTM